MLCNYAETYPNCDFILSQLEEIQKILNKKLSTAKKNISILENQINKDR